MPRASRALGTYKDFLTLWKDRDPDAPILKLAKSDYAKLQQQSLGAAIRRLSVSKILIACRWFGSKGSQPEPLGTVVLLPDLRSRGSTRLNFQQPEE